MSYVYGVNRLLKTLLKRDGEVFFTFRSDYEGVVMPTYLYNKPEVTFQIGLDMPTPIPDLQITDEAVECTLAFNGDSFFCVVPLLSIVGIHTANQMLENKTQPLKSSTKSNIIYLDEYRLARKR